MFDLGKIDKIECHTALEVELLAALVHERRLRSRCQPSPAPKPKSEPARLRFTFLPPRASDGSTPACEATIKDIQAAAAKQFHVTVNDIRSQRRDAYVCLARHAAIILCHALTESSYPTMARLFGNRDHTTILHAVRKHTPVLLELERELNRNDTIAVWAQVAFEKFMGRAKPSLPRYHESVA